MIKDRRTHQRIEKNIPLKVTCSKTGIDLITETKNLSCSGAYCIVNHDIPIMTKFKITLLLNKAGREKKPTKINCIGIVVRTEKCKETNQHRIAIFFEQLKERDKSKLEDYIQHHLSL